MLPLHFQKQFVSLDIESSKLRLDIAEQLIEEGNTLKACVKKMHLPTFAEEQQIVEIEEKRMLFRRI